MTRTEIERLSAVEVEIKHLKENVAEVKTDLILVKADVREIRDIVRERAGILAFLRQITPWVIAGAGLATALLRPG